MTYGILIPKAGIESTPPFPALEVQSLHHWSTRKVPRSAFSLIVLRLMTSSYSAPIVLLFLDFKTFCSTFHLLYDFTNFDHPDFSAFFF